MSKVIKSLLKLTFNLVILIGLMLLIYYSYILFIRGVASPLVGSVTLLIGIALWVVLIILSRRSSGHYWLSYRGVRPGLPLTFFFTLCILTTFSFAGVHPLSDFKNYTTSKIQGWLAYRPSTPPPYPSLTISPIVPPSSTTFVPVPVTPLPSQYPIIPPTSTAPKIPSSSLLPQLVLTDIVSDSSSAEIARGDVTFCKVTVKLEPTTTTTPGYYSITLLSKWTNYGIHPNSPLRYLRGENIRPLSWTISGGATWLAMRTESNLRNIFDVSYTYTPFIPLTSTVLNLPSPIEEVIFGAINNYRANIGVPIGSWTQVSQQESHSRSLAMLKEGRVLNVPLSQPYFAQLIYMGKTYTGEPYDSIARRALVSWQTNTEQLQTLQEEQLRVMSVGYTSEVRDQTFYIAVLFSTR